MMAVGSQLVQPNLANDQTLNGESISKIFTQRTIWLVPSSNITLTSQSSFKETHVSFYQFLLQNGNVGDKCTYIVHLLDGFG